MRPSPPSCANATRCSDDGSVPGAPDGVRSGLEPGLRIEGDMSLQRQENE